MQATRSYMETKGYGWMFETTEVDDEDPDDDKRPLLEELEIDLDDMRAKVRWALMPPPIGVGVVSDFWGPVAVQTVYAGLLIWGQLRVVSWILALWVAGSSIIFFLARVLGADVTLSHTLSSLGYTILPLVLSRVAMIPVGSTGVLSLALRAAGLVWATFSASRWIATPDLERKRALIVYPIGLYMFYFVAIATGV